MVTIDCQNPGFLCMTKSKTRKITILKSPIVKIVISNTMSIFLAERIIIWFLEIVLDTYISDAIPKTPHQLSPFKNNTSWPLSIAEAVIAHMFTIQLIWLTKVEAIHKSIWPQNFISSIDCQTQWDVDRSTQYTTAQWSAPNDYVLTELYNKFKGLS